MKKYNFGIYWMIWTITTDVHTKTSICYLQMSANLKHGNFFISKCSFQVKLIHHFTWVSKLNFKNILFNINPIKRVSDIMCRSEWNEVHKIFHASPSYKTSVHNLNCRSELHSIGLVFQRGICLMKHKQSKFVAPYSVNSFEAMHSYLQCNGTDYWLSFVSYFWRK
jgi:hypothetical protein